MTEKLRNELLQEEVYHEVLPSGLDVFVMPKFNYNKKYAVFATNYGSIDNAFIPPDGSEAIRVPDGIAHFLEHKLFESEEKPVFARFADLGATVNAYTSYTITSYLFSTTKNFLTCLRELIGFVQGPYFTDENVEKEKGIIEQEIRMYEDHPGRRVYSNLMQALYHQHPVRIDIGGTVESIRSITKEDLYTCYETFYHPSNMALFAVGDFSPQEVIAAVRDQVEAKGFTSREEVQRVLPDEPPRVREQEVTDQLPISRPLCYLGFKDAETGLRGRELLRKQLAAGIFLRILLGRSSQLYNDLYDEGLVDDTFSTQYSACAQYAFCTMGGETKDPARLGERLLTGIKELRQKGISTEDFQRSKKQAIGGFLHAFNSLEFIANGFLANYFRNIVMFDYVQILESLKLSDVNRCAKSLYGEDNYSISTVLPVSK